MAVNTDKLVAAVNGAVAIIERLMAENAALKAQITATGDPAADQAVVDAQADALAAEVTKAG